MSIRARKTNDRFFTRGNRNKHRTLTQAGSRYGSSVGIAKARSKPKRKTFYGGFYQEDLF